MKNEVKKILISNIYSWKNKGDAAIVISMINDVKNQFPNAEITLSTFDANDKKKYGDFKYKECISNYVYNNTDSKVLLLFKILLFVLLIKIFTLFSKIGLYPFFIFSKKIQKKIKDYESFDLVLACGGGYLLTRTNGGVLPLFVFCYDFYTAKIFNKPYILYNQSVGPFHKQWHYRLLEPILKQSNKIINREKISFNRLKNYGLSNIILKSDIAFNLESEKSEILKEYGFSKSNINFGLTVRNWLPDREQSIYESEIAKFISKMLHVEKESFFYFMPQVIYSEINDDDLVVSKRIFNLIDVEFKTRVFILDFDINPNQLKFIISQMDFFIGTRMHSNIFALSSKIKTIAISYEPKTLGIMEMLDLKPYVIEMEKVDSLKIEALYKKIRDDLNYISKLEPKIELIKKNSISDLLSFIND